MKPLAVAATLPPVLHALERALGPGGVSALDPSVPVAVWRRALSGPATEFLARPGKELRTTMVDTGWLLGGGAPTAMPTRLPMVIELLHAGSLIVDDVEDGSPERRGGPALHQLYGVPLAINTGSWMYFWALAELGDLGLPPTIELEAHRVATATLVRCHQGQALDLAIKIADVDVADVPAVVAATTRLKTGALCRLAAALGAIAAAAPIDRKLAIAHFGESVGVGLQMLDDLGSLASPARCAKGLEDVLAGRPTWPWAWLAEHRPFAWTRLAALEREVAAGTGDPRLLMAELAAEIEAVGRRAIRATLASALDHLVQAVGRSPVIDVIADALARMEQSYG